MNVGNDVVHSEIRHNYKMAGTLYSALYSARMWFQTQLWLVLSAE